MFWCDVSQFVEKMSDCINENVVEDIVHINDEALAALVKSNPYLYNKKHKDFKNVEVKKDTWKVISTCCGATSGKYFLYFYFSI